LAHDQRPQLGIFALQAFQFDAGRPQHLINTIQVAPQIGELDVGWMGLRRDREGQHHGQPRQHQPEPARN
jgi:hypothetical protein